MRGAPTRSRSRDTSCRIDRPDAAEGFKRGEGRNEGGEGRNGEGREEGLNEGGHEGRNDDEVHKGPDDEVHEWQWEGRGAHGRVLPVASPALGSGHVVDGSGAAGQRGTLCPCVPDDKSRVAVALHRRGRRVEPRERGVVPDGAVISQDRRWGAAATVGGNRAH